MIKKFSKNITRLFLFSYIVSYSDSSVDFSTMYFLWRNNCCIFLTLRTCSIRYLIMPLGIPWDCKSKECQKLHVKSCTSSRYDSRQGLLWRYMHDSEKNRECWDWHEKQHAISETPVSAYNEPTYSAINVWSSRMNRKGGEGQHAKN